MGFRKIVLPLSAYLLFITASFCHAGDESSFNDSVSVTVVNVYLVATDARNKFILDLKPDELEIQENGITQPIIGFTNLNNALNPSEDARPLNVAFLMDLSGSMRGDMGNSTRFEVVRNLALHLVEQLRPEDEMMLVGFSRFPIRATGMISDKSTIRRKLMEQQPGFESTGLFDSLYILLEQMAELQGRKIIVLCSDGDDTASRVRFEQVVDLLRGSEATILAFGIPSGDKTSLEPGRYVLRNLAEISGGAAFFPSNSSDIRKVVARLGQAIHSQYSVWYSPPTRVSDGSWRNIQILCKRPGVDLKYRQGYFAK